MPIIRRSIPCTTACGVLHWLCWLWLCGAGSQAVCTVWKLQFDSKSWTVTFTQCLTAQLEQSNSYFHTVHTACDPAPHNHSQHNEWRTPYAVVHGLILLMMGIMMPETCWDRSLIVNIILVASCWFLSFTLRIFLLHKTPVFPLNQLNHQPNLTHSACRHLLVYLFTGANWIYCWACDRENF